MSKFTLTEKLDFHVFFTSFMANTPQKDRDLLIGHGWTSENYAAFCAENGFSTLGFEYEGKPIGGLVFDGQAAHLEVLPEFHGRWASLWPGAMKWIFSHKDPIHVDVYAENEKIHHFMARNNWPRVKEHGILVTYEMSSKTLPKFLKRRFDVS